MYRVRRDRLKDEYGFVCDCARCFVEAADEADTDFGCGNQHHHSHSSEEDRAGHVHEHAHNEGMSCCDAMECCENDAPMTASDSGEIDMTYVSLFVLKHVCSDCMGTMVPKELQVSASSAGDAGVCMCNR